MVERPMVQPTRLGWAGDGPEPDPRPLDIEGLLSISRKHKDVLPWWLSYEIVPLCEYALTLEAAVAADRRSADG